MTKRTPFLCMVGLLALLALEFEAKATSHESRSATETAAAKLIDGEVRKVDKEAGKITLKHGPIPNLDMPAMSMVFRVKDPSFLDKVKAGDRVRFTAEKVQGAFTVTAIEAAK